MAGTIIADTLQGTTTTETVNGVSVTIPNTVDMKYVVNGSAKAWAGGITDSAVADDSFNISSITDLGSGENQPFWINSFDNTGYASPASCQHDTGFFNRLVAQHTKARGSVKLKTYQADNATASSLDQQLIAAGDLV